MNDKQNNTNDNLGTKEENVVTLEISFKFK